MKDESQDTGRRIGGSLSLKCCNKLCQLIETIPLYDTETRRHRVLSVGRCKNPKCGCVKAEFVYYDITKGKFITQPVPKQEVAKTIEQFKKAPYLNNYPTKIKYGSKDNMNWKYQKDGNMYDFNNVLIQKVRTELKVYGK